MTTMPRLLPALLATTLGAGCSFVSAVHPALRFDRQQAYGVVPTSFRSDCELADRYHRDAESGDTDAQGRLGLMYQFGRGVPQSDDEAYRWCRRAAEAGSATAQYHLGVLYLTGRGVEKDIVEAGRWFRKAAEQDPQHAAVKLGLLYLDFDAPRDDLALARRWFTDAAARGIALGQQALGLLDGRDRQGTEPESPAGNAQRMCVARAGKLPDHSFTTDGCSMWPDGSWSACCRAHDAAYWCGGSAEERRASDRALERCVTDAAGPFMGTLMYVGVRAGGLPWLPTPWRWGYGHPWPRTAAARDDRTPRRCTGSRS